MAKTQIFDEMACIRIVYDDGTILVHKAQVRTIDTIHGDTVRIDMGEGALYHVYVRLQDVTGIPNVTTIADLRDYIKAMLDTPAPGKASTSDATAANQQAELAQLTAIAQSLTDLKILSAANSSLTEANRIDESVPYVVYKGFAMPGTEAQAPSWAIQKISRKQDVIVYEWADGDNHFDNIWDNRYALNYLPLLPQAG